MCMRTLRRPLSRICGSSEAALLNGYRTFLALLFVFPFVRVLLSVSPEQLLADPSNDLDFL